MTLRIKHYSGAMLTQQQLDVIAPVIQRNMNCEFRSKKQFRAAIDDALKNAGCPVTQEQIDDAEFASLIIHSGLKKP